MSSAGAQQPPIMQTHQSHETAQFWFLKVVELPIKSLSLTTMSLPPLVPCVFMQRKSIIVQLEAKGRDRHVTHQEIVSGKSQGTAFTTYLMWDIRVPYDGYLLFSDGTRQVTYGGTPRYTLTQVVAQDGG